MATPKYQVAVQKVEVSDPHVGLILQLTGNPNGPFSGDTPLQLAVTINIQGESRPDVVPPILLTLPDGVTSKAVIMPFPDNQYGTNKSFSISAALDFVPLYVGGLAPTTESNFTDPAFLRSWIPTGILSDPVWQNKLAATLNPGDYLLSENQQYITIFVVTAGNIAQLITYDMVNSNIFWKTPKFSFQSGNSVFCMMVSDGNFCIYQGSYQAVYPSGYGWLWGSWQASNQGYSLSSNPMFLMLDNDGHLRIYQGSGPSNKGSVVFDLNTIRS